MQALVDALSDPDATTRSASIKAALATGAVFIDPASGELDASDLSADIGARLAANPGAKTTIDAFEEYAGGFRASWTTAAGTPNHGQEMVLQKWPVLKGDTDGPKFGAAHRATGSIHFVPNRG